jgi:hypothetical protein
MSALRPRGNESVHLSEFPQRARKGTLCHLIQRDPRIKTCKRVLMETKRTEVTSEQIQQG